MDWVWDRFFGPSKGSNKKQEVATDSADKTASSLNHSPLTTKIPLPTSSAQKSELEIFRSTFTGRVVEKTGDVLLHVYNGSCIGADRKYQFSKTIQLLNGMPLKVAPTDFYVDPRINNHFTVDPLPSSLFFQARHQDGRTCFVQNGTLYIYSVTGVLNGESCLVLPIEAGFEIAKDQMFRSLTLFRHDEDVPVEYNNRLLGDRITCSTQVKMISLGRKGAFPIDKCYPQGQFKRSSEGLLKETFNDKRYKLIVQTSLESTFQIFLDEYRLIIFIHDSCGNNKCLIQPLPYETDQIDVDAIAASHNYARQLVIEIPKTQRALISSQNTTGSFEWKRKEKVAYPPPLYLSPNARQLGYEALSFNFATLPNLPDCREPPFYEETVLSSEYPHYKLEIDPIPYDLGRPKAILDGSKLMVFIPSKDLSENLFITRNIPFEEGELDLQKTDTQYIGETRVIAGSRQIQMKAVIKIGLKLAPLEILAANFSGPIRKGQVCFDTLNRQPICIEKPIEFLNKARYETDTSDFGCQLNLTEQDREPIPFMLPSQLFSSPLSRFDNTVYFIQNSTLHILELAHKAIDSKVYSFDDCLRQIQHLEKKE
jgi:hypothetical protein